VVRCTYRIHVKFRAFQEKNGIEKDLWNESDIIHIIGKDIMYFHLLFWPAVLTHSNYKVPTQIQVHGFLTVDGEKMSKSRGTFILAKDMKQKINPELLRYFFASQSGSGIQDIDYNEKELQNKVNHELISNLMNMHYRIGSLIEKKKVNAQIDEVNHELVEAILKKHYEFLELISKFEINNAIRIMLSMGDMINKYLQENKPWAINDPSIVLRNSYYSALLTLPSLYCIMPRTAAEIATQYGVAVENIINVIMKEQDPKTVIDKLHGLQKNESLTVNPKIIYNRIEIVKDATNNSAKEQRLPYENLSLIVAEIIEANEHPDAESLYILNLNLGKETRQIVSGLREHYTIIELVGRKIVIVENMKPAKIRGIESKGMLLAGSVIQNEKEKVILLEPHEKSVAGDKVFSEKEKDKLDEITKDNKNNKVQATIKDVQKSNIIVKNKVVYSPLGILMTKDGSVTLELPDDAKIH
jgi:methionyl-tRNA synthetase